MVKRAKKVAATETGCTNYPPRDFSGHWRDWHRGHGCDKDDSKPTAAPVLTHKDGFRPFPDGPAEKLVRRIFVVPTFQDGGASLSQAEFAIELKIPVPSPRLSEKGEDSVQVNLTVTCAPGVTKDRMGRIYVSGIPERLWLARAVLDRIQESRSVFFGLAAKMAMQINLARETE